MEMQNNPNEQYRQNELMEQYKPITAWGYVGYSLLYLIPIVGIILLIVHACSSKKIARRSYARSYFARLLLVLILMLLFAVLPALTGGMSDFVYNFRQGFNEIIDNTFGRRATPEPIYVMVTPTPDATEKPAATAKPTEKPSPEDIEEETVAAASYEEEEEVKTLARGSSGEDVRALQERLKELGYLTGSADGSYGGMTERAVSAFQAQNGLDETGIADPDTQDEIFSMYADPAPTEEPTAEPTEKPAEEKKASGVTPKFKKAMDEYEAYFDEYFELMDQIERSPNDVMLTLKMPSLLAKCAKALEACEKIDEDELNEYDLAYYTEVMARITKKAYQLGM